MPFVPYQKHAPIDASLPLCTLLFGSEDGEEEIPAALNMRSPDFASECGI